MWQSFKYLKMAIVASVVQTKHIQLFQPSLVGLRLFLKSFLNPTEQLEHKQKHQLSQRTKESLDSIRFQGWDHFNRSTIAVYRNIYEISPGNELIIAGEFKTSHNQATILLPSWQYQVGSTTCIGGILGLPQLWRSKLSQTRQPWHWYRGPSSLTIPEVLKMVFGALSKFPVSFVSQNQVQTFKIGTCSDKTL